MPLGLISTTSTTDAAIQRKFWIRYDNTNSLWWKNELYHEIVKSLEDASLLIKVLVKQFKINLKN